MNTASHPLPTKTVPGTDPPPSGGALPAPADQIQSHLELVLHSPVFSSSRRSQTFLRYVVDETLAGRGHLIKERNIALDVFGRREDFDPQNESVVRVTAVDVRKRLAHFYETADPAPPAIRIELPTGAYRPVFQVPPAPAAAQKSSRPRLTAVVISVLCVSAVAAALAGWTFVRARSQTSLDLLWKPLAVPDRPVLISLPSPTVYQLQHEEQYLPLRAGQPIDAGDVRPMESYFVGIGAAQGAARFAEQLAFRKQPFYLKFGHEVSFADLRQSPAILLGSFTSKWSLELIKPLRFRIESVGSVQRIIDTTDPKKRAWEVPITWRLSDRRDGYALVTRLLHSESGRPVLVAAGFSAVDTQAAVEFLTNAQYFDVFANAAPPDWSRKNFQVVLHNSLHGNAPGPPSLVAWHTWQ